MVKIAAEKFKYFVTALSLFFVVSCANQLPPEGGEIDTTPPEIISTYPEDGTINFSDNYFKVRFSEYVDKRSFRDAIFISPAVEGELEVSWTGRTVTITFPAGLKKDFTYVVTIGTDVVDLNNRNRMAKALNLSFSTGDKIDTRTISGRVYDKQADGVLIFAYKVTDDTTDYLILKPDYISQVGKDGRFILNGLAESDYRIFAIKDQIRDLLFQSEMDKIGVPFADISLKNTDTAFVGLNFFLMSADTTKPRLISAIMTDDRHILVTVSKQIDSTLIDANNFSVIDSTENIEYGALYAFKGNTKNEEFVVVTENRLPAGNTLFLRADRLIDKFGNLYTDDYSALTVSERADTSILKIFKTFPTDLKKLDFKNPIIRFYFDDAFNKDEITDAIFFTDTIGNNIQFSLIFPDDATFEIAPLSNLQNDKDYLIKLNLSKFKDVAQNFNDTTVTYNIRTISGLEFTGVSGRVSAKSLEDFILVLQSAELSELKYQTTVNSKNEFNFERTEAGKFLLWGFYDLNNNDKYDYGYPSPLEYSERFFVYRDTLELRPRWSITDILFDVRE